MQGEVWHTQRRRSCMPRCRRERLEDVGLGERGDAATAKECWQHQGTDSPLEPSEEAQPC